MWPFNLTKKSVQPSGLVAPEQWFLTHFGGGEPGAVGVTAAQALAVPAVQSAIRLLSEACATLDITVQRRQGRAWKDAPDHPAWRLITDQVNDWTSSFEFIRLLVAECLTNDQGGFAVVSRNSEGRPVEVIKYNNGSVAVEYAADGSGEPRYTRNGKVIPTRDVIHLHNAFERSPLTLARRAIGFAATLESYGAHLFANGARPGGILRTKKPLGDKGVEAMLRGWAASFGGAHNAGKTPVLWDDTEYTQLGLTSTDAEFLANRKFQILEIARAFRVPPGMLYDLDRQTWSNGEQMGREFLSYSLEPWLRGLEGALSRALLTDDERRTTRIVIDRDDLTRASLTERATAISAFITSRAISPNEARAWIDMPPREGGDVYENPAIDLARQKQQ